MAQHDMNIANQGFPATRADLNNALQALVSNSSGTSAPSTTFANQWWYDTTNNKLYIRNEANNAWIEVAVLDQTNNEWQISTGVIQAKDSDGLALKTDDGTTRLFIKDSDGNIGLGNSSPVRKLEISGNNNGGSKANYIRITDTDTSATADNQQGGIEFYTSDSGNENVTASIENLYAGSGAGSQLTFNTAPTGSSGVSERVRIDENGNVGIGTETRDIDEKLHLEHDVSGEDVAVKIQNLNASSGANAVLNLTTVGNNFSIKAFPDADTSNANRTAFDSTAGGAYYTFDVASDDDSDAALCLREGLVGFGTDDPASFVPSNVSGGRDIVAKGSGGATFVAARDDSTIAAGNVIGSYLIRSNDVSGVRFGGMRGLADDSSGNFHLEFFAGNTTTDQAGSEGAFQISDVNDIFVPKGHVYVGRSAEGTYNSTEESFSTYYNNSATFTRIIARAPSSGGDDVYRHQDSGTVKSEIESNGDFLSATNSYGSTSDERLKENIEASGSQWDDIKALQIKKYSMKDDNLDAPNMLGVIAQDLQASGMNGLVKTHIIKDDEDNPILDDDGNEQNFLSVKYSVLYMKAIKALQEAMTRIETLETQNTTQATQIADLITRVQALEA